MATDLYDPEIEDDKKKKSSTNADGSEGSSIPKEFAPQFLQDMENKDSTGSDNDTANSGKSDKAEADEKEELADKGDLSPHDSNDLYNPDSSGKTKGKASGLLNGGWNKKAKRRAMLIGGSSASIIIIIIMIIALLGSLKAVHFATILRSAGFAQFNYYASRQFSQAAFDGAVLSGGSTGSFELSRRTLLDRVRGINTKKQLKQLGREDTLKFNTERLPDGSTRVKSVKINGVDSETLDQVAQRNFSGKNYSDLSARERWTVESDFANSIKDGLSERLAIEGRNVRSSVYDGLRQAFDIRFGKWANALKDFGGKSPEEARAENYAETEKNVSGSGSNVSSGNDKVNEDAQVLEKTQAEAAKTGNPLSRTELGEKVNTFKTDNADALNKASLAVLASTLACMAHDVRGSVAEIGKQNQAKAERQGYDMNGGSDQIKDGKKVVAEAVGAEGARYDGGENAVMYKMSFGEPVTAEDAKQADDIPSVSSVSIPGLAAIDDTLKTAVSLGTNKLAEHVPYFGDKYNQGVDAAIDATCKVVLDKYVQFGIAGVEIGFEVINPESSAIITPLKEAFKFGATIGAGEIVGAGMDKYIKSISGADFSGTAAGPDLVNQGYVDNSLMSQTGNRQITYGAPLPDADAVANQKLAMGEMKDKMNSGSWQQRYFATSNPFSLTSRLVAYAPSNTSSATASLANFFATGFTHVFSQLSTTFMMLLGGSKVLADSNTDLLSQHSFFGVDQWGWTQKEYAKMASDESFDSKTGALDTYYNAHAGDIDESTCDPVTHKNCKTYYERYTQCYAYVKQSDKPDFCNTSYLTGDVALHWRAYNAEGYAADRLSEDLGTANTASSNNNTVADGTGTTYVLGDSLVVGMNGEGDLSTKLTTNGLAQSSVVSGLVGRHIAIGDNPGIQQEKNDANTDVLKINKPSRVIVDLGTNDFGLSPTTFAEQAQTLITNIKTDFPGAQIYWLTLYSTESSGISYPALNAKLLQLAQTEKIHIIDWAAVAKPYYEPNSLHPFGHYDAMADFVITEIQRQE